MQLSKVLVTMAMLLGFTNASDDIDRQLEKGLAPLPKENFDAYFGKEGSRRFDENTSIPPFILKALKDEVFKYVLDGDDRRLQTEGTFPLLEFLIELGPVPICTLFASALTFLDNVNDDITLSDYEILCTAGIGIGNVPGNCRLDQYEYEIEFVCGRVVSFFDTVGSFIFFNQDPWVCEQYCITYNRIFCEPNCIN